MGSKYVCGGHPFTWACWRMTLCLMLLSKENCMAHRLPVSSLRFCWTSLHVVTYQHFASHFHGQWEHADTCCELFSIMPHFTYSLSQIEVCIIQNWLEWLSSSLAGVCGDPTGSPRGKPSCRCTIPLKVSYKKNVIIYIPPYLGWMN